MIDLGLIGIMDRKSCRLKVYHTAIASKQQMIRGCVNITWHTLFCFTIIFLVNRWNTQQEIKCGTLAHPLSTKSCYASTILVNRNPYNKASPYRRFVKRSWSTIEQNEFGVWHAIKRITLSRRHSVKPCKNIFQAVTTIVFTTDYYSIFYR